MYTNYVTFEVMLVFDSIKPTDLY